MKLPPGWAVPVRMVLIVALEVGLHLLQDQLLLLQMLILQISFLKKGFYSNSNIGHSGRLK